MQDAQIKLEQLKKEEVEFNEKKKQADIERKKKLKDDEETRRQQHIARQKILEELDLNRK